MIQEAIARTVTGRELAPHHATRVMLEVMRGEATDAQIGGLLAALRMRGETASEIASFARAMDGFAVRVTAEADGTLVDTCGTGGDGANTFNISTAAAIVAAGAGVPVVKHGNRSVSSRCGSADVLEALGARIDLPPETAAGILVEAGLVFLYAPVYHPAMRHVAAIRQEMGIRTVFNLLGPLLNPAGAEAQLLGVYDPALVGPIAEALADLGRKRAFVVHGSGLDELTTTGPSTIAALDGGGVETYTLSPEDLGLTRVPLAALAGGNPEENARIITDLLSGEGGAAREVVLLNAAAAIVLGGMAPDLDRGVSAAERAVDSGAALDRLERLIRATGGEPCFSTT
jgi:anthranilate phosphoribosyltransferase